MKKYFFSLMFLTLFCLQGFSQVSENDQNLISNFVNSPEYSRVRGIYSSGLGEIDYEKSNVTYADDNISKPVINIVFTSNKMVKGVIKSVPLQANQSNVLPGNERFIMTLIDYRQYDADIKSGGIKVIDLNYDNHIPLDILVDHASITNVVVSDLPESIVTKYAGLTKKKDLGNPVYSNGQGRTATHHCDLNGNGNVTWSECFTCMVRACSSNQTCAVLCGITNVVGAWVGSLSAGACTTSMATSCVYLSIVY